MPSPKRARCRSTDYEATLRVTPIVDGDRAFVEWWATFDCAPAERTARVAFFRDAFAGWLESLRRSMHRGAEPERERVAG